MLAELPEVGGVETRDGSLLEFSVARPALVAYTTPPQLEIVQARAESIASGMGLSLEVEAEHREDDDWRDSWKRFYRPMRFGDGALLLRPSWVERRPDDPARELVIDPGRAFGTGLHESTRICMELLVEVFDRREEQPSHVLDLGCGSGILGLAALRLSPKLLAVHFVDIDEEAVETSRENLALNDELGRSTFATGVVADLAEAAYPLVLANIRPSVLIPQAAAIAARVAPGGLLILSGILLEESAEIASTYSELGLEEIARPPMNDWCGFLYRRPN
jgi:ribosomal protein L11 methyltransferase